MTRSGHLPRLIVMTRYPQAGVVKTRLASELGEDAAAQIHSDLARHCVRRMHAVALSGDVQLEVRSTGATPRKVRRWLGRNVSVREQSPGDLGSRLAEACTSAIAEGAPAVVVVGSDAPELGGVLVREALSALDRTDVVLGPAADGGYYLVGMTASAAERTTAALFTPEIPWGTSDVLQTTLAAAERSGLSVSLLEEVADVDRPEDLAIWDGALALQERTRTHPRLSVIIPALNEEENIAVAVGSALAAKPHEVIVVDAGSTDRTAKLAEEAGATTVIESTCGRASQINAGAGHASGEVLFFLHADSRAPDTALADIRDVLADPTVVLGSFSFDAGSPNRLSDRLMSFIGRTRHRLFRLPYGDQGQFVRRVDFEDLGGMPEMPTMEDYEFALICKRWGRLGVSRTRLWTSGRGWDEHGIVAVALVNSAVIVGYRMGVGIERLAVWRDSVAERD